MSMFDFTVLNEQVMLQHLMRNGGISNRSGGMCCAVWRPPARAEEGGSARVAVPTAETTTGKEEGSLPACVTRMLLAWTRRAAFRFLVVRQRVRVETRWFWGGGLAEVGPPNVVDLTRLLACVEFVRVTC